MSASFSQCLEFTELNLVTYRVVSTFNKVLSSNFKRNRTTFYRSLNGVFSFSLYLALFEILRFFETCKLGVSDVIVTNNKLHL